LNAIVQYNKTVQ